MTIQDIEQQLLDASVQGDLNTISTIILSLNESQAAQINPLVYDKVLGQLSLPYIGADPADTIRIVMEFASPYISSFTLGGVLANLAWNDNLGGLDAVIDNLTEVHLLPYPYGGLDDFTVSNVLDALVSNVQWHMNMGDDITAHNTAIRDFMEILGGHVTASAVGEALANLAWYDDLEGLDAIIDNLTAEHLLPEYQGGLSG
ncbi:MAG: hypothetical protein KDJ75_06715, partial [Alphaproteobacteria bacterium]|nr:hypothetical protein [Alphaproteobacteria bacterium]